jgi:hypothetical protein
MARRKPPAPGGYRQRRSAAGWPKFWAAEASDVETSYAVGASADGGVVNLNLPAAENALADLELALIPLLSNGAFGFRLRDPKFHCSRFGFSLN